MKSILPAVLLLALAPSAFAQKTPDEALKSFTVADGLQIELFASEPMFVNPTCIDIDHKGRVWVCESVNYRCDLRKTKRNRPEGDRILVLEDTKGTGKADKVTVFYQSPDLIAPLGIAVMPYPDGKGQRIYVCHSPHIYVFEDKDGDLKADGPPKILLTGFKGYDHDHGVHGIHFGPDGKLYFSVGDQGVDKLSSANGNFLEKVSGVASAPRAPGANATGLAERIWTTNRTDCQAATCWRCNPDGTNLELLAHNFRNPYEPAVDSFGTVFMSDNDDDGNQQTRICYVMPGGNYGYWPRNKGDHHWHEDQPGVVHKVLRTGFGSPTGMCWYEGSLLRNAFEASRGSKPPVEGEKNQTPPGTNVPGSPVYGYLLHTDAGPREVRCFVVKPKGAGYELDKINLVTSTDNWFRPSDVCVAPDGSVMVADWYDPGVGGHGMGDTTRGRIYRLTPKGHKGYKVPVMTTKTHAGLVEAISSPCLACRVMAATCIIEATRTRPEFLADVEDTWRADFYKNRAKDAPSTPFENWMASRFSWLQLYDPTHLSSTRSRLEEPMKDADSYRKSVVESERRAWRLNPGYQQRVNHVVGTMRLMKDEVGDMSKLDPVILKYFDVRLYDEAPIDLLREFLLSCRDAPAEYARDRIYRYAKLYDGQDLFYLAAINIAVGTDAKRREIILADFEKHFPEWNDRVAKLVWELRPPAVIAKLDQKLADPKLTAEQKKQILEILAFADGDTGGRVFLKMLAAKETSLEELDLATKTLAKHLPSRWAGLKNSAEMKTALDRLFSGPRSTIFAIELVRAGELADYVDRLRTIAATDDQPLENRQGAARALGAIKTKESLAALLGLWESNLLNHEVIEALGRHGSPEAVATLGKITVNSTQTADLNDAAVSALAASRPGTQWLLEAHAQKKLPESVIPAVARVLRNSPYQDLRNKAMVAFPAPGKLDPKKLPPIAKLVKRLGDPQHGRELFANNKDVGCIRCHAVRGIGGNIGPDLSMIGKKGSRENLFESIMDPDKAIADQFTQWVVLDKRGVSLSGILVEETPDYVIIRDGFGKDNKLWTKDIDEKAKSKKSVMPSDIVAYLSEQDLVDVVSYLETLKTPALSPDSWHILGPFDNGQNDAGLDKEFIPEPGSRERKLPVVDLTATYDGKSDKVKWTTVRLGADGYVNLQAFYRFDSRDIVSYLYREIESPADQEATILIGTDDGCKLWVNAEEVLSHKRHEAATPERDTVKVKLKKGVNSILLKINNGDGPHGFYFTVVSEQELKLGK